MANVCTHTSCHSNTTRLSRSRRHTYICSCLVNIIVAEKKVRCFIVILSIFIRRDYLFEIFLFYDTYSLPIYHKSNVVIDKKKQKRKQQSKGKSNQSERVLFLSLF